MNYQQFLNGQDPSLSRYVPPTLTSTSPTMGNSWNNNQGGYAYNLPTSFGGFGGFSQYSRQRQLAPNGLSSMASKPASGNRMDYAQFLRMLKQRAPGQTGPVGSYS